MTEGERDARQDPGKEESRISAEPVGLVPAGGQATRIAPLPCSKEVYPLGFRTLSTGHGIRPKVAIHDLLDSMRLAGAARAYIVLRQGKWDIPAYLSDGKMLGMHLAYLMMDLPFGVPFTLDQARPFVQDALVVFGFPDIIFEPLDAFSRLRERQAETGADLVLGLFPARQPHKMDMVELDDDGRIRSIRIKPTRTDLIYTWINAVWTPVFTHFMHEYVVDAVESGADSGRETFVGDVIQAAIHDGMNIDKVLFDEGSYIDIGTPEDLATAVRKGL